MKSLEELNAELRLAYGDFIAYRASSQSKSFVVLMDALIAIRQNELIHVTPENLMYAQGQLHQLIALRSSVVEPDKETIFT